MSKYAKFLLILVMFFVVCNHSFADVVKPNTISKFYDDKKNIYEIEGQTNNVLNTITSKMTKEDEVELRKMVVNFFAGEKDLLNDMIALVGKYSKSPDYLLNYVLFEKSVTPVARYQIINGELNPIADIDQMLISYYKEEDLTKAYYIWDKIKQIWPIEDLQHISYFHLSKNKEEDAKIAISILDPETNTWTLDIDEDLFFYYDDLKYNIQIGLAFYHALNMDNVINVGVNNKNTYTLRGLQYAEDSAINKFYKRFWKGRKTEYDVEQSSKYVDHFFNTKASRTCYDDFAISFLQYALKGKRSTSKTVLSDKLMFFDNLSEYTALAHWIKARDY